MNQIVTYLESKQAGMNVVNRTKEIGIRKILGAAHILDRLSLKNTAELVRYAIKNNLIALD